MLPFARFVIYFTFCNILFVIYYTDLEGALFIHAILKNILYCIIFKYLYSAPQHPWSNRGAFASINSKKRDKF